MLIGVRRVGGPAETGREDREVSGMKFMDPYLDGSDPRMFNLCTSIDVYTLLYIHV